MTTSPLPPEIAAHYAAGQEAARLTLGHGLLEAERTRELLLRHLPPAPSLVLDVGGGPGAYACWLAARGHVVHLVDSIPSTVGVEGPGWLLPDVEARWADPGTRDQLLMAARAVEREPSLLGLSAHIMVVARRPPAGMR